MIAALLAFAIERAAPPRCVAGPDRVSAARRLTDAADAMGMSRLDGRVLHYSPNTARELADQSDRAYPPFIQQFATQDRWFDVRSDIERIGGGPGGGAVLRGPGATFRVRDSVVAPAPELHASMAPQRNFNPWAVIADWQRDTTVRVFGRCEYLDGVRVVLTRHGALGEERLYLDPGNHFPMRLLATELHYFLGPVHDDYRYTAWSDVAPFVYYPSSAIKLTDGLGQETWTVQDHALVRVDSAPAFSLPGNAPPMSPIPPPRFGDTAPDTVRVGPRTFLLVGDRFTSAITLARDTVFVLDAAAGEERARRDSAWIERLFPRKPVTLVLLNAVWPHIAGVRFWVASHARVVAPVLARHTVEQALARRWTEHPDKYERVRRSSPLHLTTVADSLALGGGAVRLYMLDGIGNEGILMSYVPADGFLWASDRIQDVHAPSLYVAELVKSVERAHLEPRWTAGPHTARVPWEQITRLVP